MYEIIILLLNIKECRVMSYNPIYSFLKTQYIVFLNWLDKNKESMV